MPMFSAREVQALNFAIAKLESEQVLAGTRRERADLEETLDVLRAIRARVLADIGASLPK